MDDIAIEHLGFRGGVEALLLPPEKRDAEPLLDLLKRPADGGLGDVERSSSRRDAALFDDGPENRERRRS
jgi:hypothetical protein